MGSTFGDFANGGQVIIDQFINSSSQNGEEQATCYVASPRICGQGPEHSSARLEISPTLCWRKYTSSKLYNTLKLFSCIKKTNAREFRNP